MKLLLGSLLLSLSGILHAEVNLDQMMTAQEKQQTGFSSLTPTQKQALNVWIDKHFTVNETPQPPEKTLYLSINMNNGAMLELSDGSRWEVSPHDRAVSRLWLTPFPLKLVPTNETAYPYFLVNLNNQDRVRVRPAPNAYPQPSPTP